MVTVAARKLKINITIIAMTEYNIVVEVIYFESIPLFARISSPFSIPLIRPTSSYTTSNKYNPTMIWK